ncbi:hypothetical protein AK812_SmicGene13511 [Symbiodinium microadriaticum]|uniref:Uncharacterized protein n=1 Tax=Symbiodinium microadriaticum TaxID=2951 RepID=A0A1Q9E7Y6_SYMMI|nr:hypothetical protein AK812_SmicGene13511 [Symbiodinium microadriaticum]
MGASPPSCSKCCKSIDDAKAEDADASLDLVHAEGALFQGVAETEERQDPDEECHREKNFQETTAARSGFEFFSEQFEAAKDQDEQQDDSWKKLVGFASAGLAK